MTSRWSEIFTLYRWELRSALRDRATVICSVVLPLVLYPAMFWIAMTAHSFMRGQTEGGAARVHALNLPDEHGELRDLFRKDKRFAWTEASGVVEEEELIRARRFETVLSFERVESEPAGNFRARLIYDRSRDRSEAASRRVSELLGTYRDRWLRREAVARGVTPTRWVGFAIERRNTAGRRDMGAFLLGLLLPNIFVIMVASGCFYPAIDSTAGERERNTWETLMSTAAARTSIVAAKFLSVTTLGGLAGLLNVVSLLLTMRGIVAPAFGSEDASLDFTMRAAAIPVLVMAAVLLAGLVAAGMMVCAVFARTFQEGQSLATPWYLATILPVVFLSTPGTALTLPLAFVPVVNLGLVVRGALAGTLPLREAVVAALATLLAIALLVRLAALILSVENVVVASHSGSLGRFLRERLRRRKSTVS